MIHQHHAGWFDRCRDLASPVISIGRAAILLMVLSATADARSRHAYLPPSTDENPWQHYLVCPP
jgi:hypothetical protein